MKSRTLYCDKTILKKNLTRFAPAWIIYTICLLLGMILLWDDNYGYWFHRKVAQLIPIMSIINLGYALLAAQLLFGDLYNTRMCNAIHALPVTRDALFLSNVSAGLLWSVIPTGLATVLALLLGIGSEVENGWQIPLYWLLGANLEYLFFFGLAAFSALCVGNRFAQAVVYGITNFASIIAFWLVDTLYVPMLYGVRTNEEPFMRFSPSVWFASCEYLDVERDMEGGMILRAWFEFSDGWGYLAICAVLGVGLLAAALALYRRRSLEAAGDFMAVKALEPVFLVVYPLIIAAGFYFFCDQMMSVGGTAVVYMLVGLAIGFFTGQMLLERSIRVFRKKTVLRFVALALCFGATLLATALDPLGIESWVPDGDDVACVSVSPSYSRHSTYNLVTLDDPEEIADIIRVHEIALEEQDAETEFYAPTVEAEFYDGVYFNNQAISIHYQMKNGTTKSRYYLINLNGKAGEILTPYFNTFEAIFSEYTGDKSFEGILKATQNIEVNCDRYEGFDDKVSIDVDGYSFAITDQGMIRELLDAIAADAQLGVMAQNWNFRPDPDVGCTYWLYFDLGNETANITVYADCINTNTWLHEHGFISRELEDVVKFGGLDVVWETA